MLYEDLRSHCVKSHKSTLRLEAEMSDLKEELQVQKDENDGLDKQVAQ